MVRRFLTLTSLALFVGTPFEQVSAQDMPLSQFVRKVKETGPTANKLPR